jgi:hypothetical protein
MLDALDAPCGKRTCDVLELEDAVAPGVARIVEHDRACRRFDEGFDFM